MTQNDRKNDFSQGGVLRLIIRQSIPLIGAQIINALYSIVDKMYIGRIPDTGKLAFAGVGLTFPFILMVNAFALLAGMGGSPLCSIARGEGKIERAEKIMGNSLTLLVILGVAVTGLSLAFRRPLLYWFGASDATMPFADAYISLYLTGSMFVMLTLGMNPFINSQGFPRTGMATVAIGAITNVLLDPFFIFTLEMGVSGAALATVISQCLSAIWVMNFLTGKKCILKLRLKNMAPDIRLVGRILALGASSCTMSVTNAIVSIVCNRTLSIYGGDTYVGVMSAISSIREVLMMPVSGFGQGAQPVMGYNFGAKRFDRVKKCVKYQLVICASYASFITVLTLAFPSFCISLFNSDPELIRAGIPAVRTYFCLFFMLSLQMTGQYSFVALGRSKEAMFFSLLRKAFIVAPLAVLLPRFMGVMGVFAAEPVSDLVGSSACFITFMLTQWRRLEKGTQGSR
ncbi:MAG: MATE family efflux transporter [Clostridia bacterium]|nr:MATE family efflux transporter [Clostridia bacterium]